MFSERSGRSATVRDWSTGVAAFQFASPAWLAVIVVEPAATPVTLPPLMVATLVFELE